MQLKEIESITAGHVSGSGSVAFDSVSIDTRTLRPGALFVAISGPNFDGNDFVESAARSQAVAAVVGRTVKSVLPTVTVADTRAALGQLGLHNRQQSKATVIGLTGSQGKTTVKEMLAGILGNSAEVLVTRGNLNNDLGVPLTLLEIGAGHDYAVIEMGANAPGEIAYTTALVQPDIAHITNAAGTHLEGFGSIEGVARSKGEIWDGIRSDGVAVINLDDAYGNFWLSQNQDRNRVTVSAKGKPDADYSAHRIRLAGMTGSVFDLHTPRGQVEVTLSLLGVHNVANAVAAAAMTLEAGASLEDVVLGLARVQPVPGRLNLKQGLNGCQVIDDTYNASPASFRAAIDVLSDFPGEQILVAGDMGELGDSAEQAHDELGQYASMKGIDHVYVCGKLSALTASGFGGNAVHEMERDALVPRIKRHLKPGVTILVKGSRSAGMEKFVRQITEQEGV